MLSRIYEKIYAFPIVKSCERAAINEYLNRYMHFPYILSLF